MEGEGRGERGREVGNGYPPVHPLLDDGLEVRAVFAT